MKKREIKLRTLQLFLSTTWLPELVVPDSNWSLCATVDGFDFWVLSVVATGTRAQQESQEVGIKPGQLMGVRRQVDSRQTDWGPGMLEPVVLGGVEGTSSSTSSI